jgi:23S rRNA (adenine2503-C2)-methyltransferase
MKTLFYLNSKSDIDTTSFGSAIRLEFGLPNLGALETSALDLPHRQPRIVICAPSQYGCVFQCQFCGLHSSHKTYNLSPEEEIALIDETLRYAISSFNIQNHMHRWQLSFMGQGEPLLNLNTIRIVMEHYLRDSNPPLFGISTIGIPSRLRQLGKFPSCFLQSLKLQISLHAPTDLIRHKIMPGTKTWSISEMLDSAKPLVQSTDRPICLNYLLLNGINDDFRSLEILSRIADPNYFYIKLSSLNRVSDITLEATDPTRPVFFASELKKRGCNVKIFHSAGSSIRAGCGQLGILELPPALDLLYANEELDTSVYESAFIC